MVQKKFALKQHLYLPFLFIYSFCQYICDSFMPYCTRLTVSQSILLEFYVLFRLEFYVLFFILIVIFTVSACKNY